MKHSHGSTLVRNKFSFILISIYTIVLLVMCSGSSASILKTIYPSMFPILVFVGWSHFYSKKTLKQTKQDAFRQDLFLISYAFYLGFLLFIISDFRNVDIRGWWPLAMLITFAYGFVFAFIYSLIGILAKRSNFYQNFSFIAIFLLLATMKIWPMNLLGFNSPFALILVTILITHFLYCFMQRLFQKNRHFNES